MTLRNAMERPMSLWIILGFFTILYGIAVWFCFQGLGKLHKGQSRKTPSVSVIVAARNERDHIRDCLDSLLRQNYSGRYDITVADDQSTDGTARLVGELAQQHDNLRLIQLQRTRRGWAPKKHALNEAIENSTGEIICATDADCTPSPTWIQGLIRQFDPSVGMVAGLVQINRPHRPGSLWIRLQALELFSLFTTAAGGLGNKLALSASGGNLAYRREAFRQAGGFQQIKHLVSGDDDLLLQHMAAKTNWEAKFCVDPGTFVTTKAMPNLRSFLRQRRRWASKAPHQRPSLICFLIITFLLNLSLLITLPATMATSRWVAAPLTCLAVKTLSEIALLWRGARLLGRMDLLKIFPLWELVHIPYVVFMGLAGLFGGHIWKGRKYSGQNRSDAGGGP
jgi:cellulose synthase/poly-beta-1,6-N-acetylglucosamine synthase-like glycosyltransferase